jgi:hypothetical protein
MLIEHEKPDGDKAQFDITGHVPDPVSLSIIGCILMRHSRRARKEARVKKIGGSEFYEGIPRSLAIS